MREYQSRVICERDELSKKLEALQKFTGDLSFANVPSDERGRLICQREIMVDYLNILDERISYFE